MSYILPISRTTQVGETLPSVYPTPHALDPREPRSLDEQKRLFTNSAARAHRIDHLQCLKESDQKTGEAPHPADVLAILGRDVSGTA